MKNTKNNEEVKEIKINNVKKISFFKRMKNAILKLENYGEFILEKTSVAIIYFLKLIILISIAVSIVSTYDFSKIVNKGFNYIKNELPDFSYANGKIIFSEDTEAYDKDLDFHVIINTKSEVSDSIENELKEKTKDYAVSLVFLQDKIIITEYDQAIEYSYSDLESIYNKDTLNKQELISVLDSIGTFGINSTYFVALVLTSFIINLLNVIIDVLLVYLFGLIISKICGVKIPNSKVLSLSIYALTLSILLSATYSIIYSLTGFVIEYFDIMYLMVAYVYLIAAILIIKSDVIKQKIELQKIVNVQKEVKKELDEQKQEDDKQKENKDSDEKKDENKKDDDPIGNREPDGSEI